MKSSITSPIDAPQALSFFEHEPVNRLVSEIFTIKVADTDTHTYRYTNKQVGRLIGSRAAKLQATLIVSRHDGWHVHV